MKLKTLHIDKYKNLNKDFDFSNNNGYIALIGLNGSGKSNLLEAISAVFNRLSGIEDNTPEIADFSVDYELAGNEVNHKQGDSIESGSVPENELPSALISCYSGEDSRLWEKCYQAYYVSFFKQAITATGDFKPKTLYINKYCWKIAFISLLYSENEKIKSFIRNTLSIEATSVRIKFKENTNISQPIIHQASNWYSNVKDKFQENDFGIEELKEVILDNYKHTDLTDDAVLFYYLYLLSMPEKNDKIGMTVDKLIEDIEITINGYSFDALSEGEKKIILIECITKILGDKDSLVLLDEPDAHTHIAMKKYLLKLISEFDGQTIMTTHSPMFLNRRWDGYNDSNVYYMHDGKIENSQPLKHLAELTDNAIDYFDGSFILSSKNILVTEGTYDGLYLNKAISTFEKEDAKYSKLRYITIVYSGGTGNALTFYEQILKGTSDLHDKIVYLFDYDKAGLTGWKAITEIADPKVTPIFYQEDYSVVLETNVNNNNIAPKDTIMVEDLFDPQSYKSKVKVVHDMNTHKEFRCNTQGKTTDAIKSFIEKNYNDFGDEWLTGFRPILDKLIEIFNL